MTNFDFLLKDRQFSSFAPIAVKAEHLLHIDTVFLKDRAEII